MTGSNLASLITQPRTDLESSKHHDWPGRHCCQGPTPPSQPALIAMHPESSTGCGLRRLQIAAALFQFYWNFIFASLSILNVSSNSTCSLWEKETHSSKMKSWRQAENERRNTIWTRGAYFHILSSFLVSLFSLSLLWFLQTWIIMTLTSLFVPTSGHRYHPQPRLHNIPAKWTNTLNISEPHQSSTGSQPASSAISFCKAWKVSSFFMLKAAKSSGHLFLFDTLEGH